MFINNQEKSKFQHKKTKTSFQSRKKVRFKKKERKQAFNQEKSKIKKKRQRIKIKVRTFFFLADSVVEILVSRFFSWSLACFYSFFLNLTFFLGWKLNFVLFSWIWRVFFLSFLKIFLLLIPSLKEILARIMGHPLAYIFFIYYSNFIYK